MKEPFVAYYRVSTQRQGVDGLGMNAQRDAVQRFLNGGALLAEFAEVESGGRNDRPELAKALKLCKEKRATLLIARLDRLSRNASFLLNLRDSGVSFRCCDMPEANKLTIGILAVVAEDERDRISERTKAALQAARARGVRLGNPRIAAARKLAIASNRRKAQEFAAQLAPLIARIQKAGIVSLRGIAESLNARGVRTPNGRDFTPQSVKNLLALIARTLPK